MRRFRERLPLLGYEPALLGALAGELDGMIHPCFAAGPPPDLAPIRTTDDAHLEGGFAASARATCALGTGGVGIGVRPRPRR